MNNKKIVGNASKATLPGGKKMEDYKKPPSYNSATKTNAQAGSGNPAQVEDKQKSKGAQTAQAAGTEAAKEALKKAAGAIPYTKWIPKGIRDKIIDKFMDSDLGQAAVEKAMKDVKRKLILAIASLVGSIVLSILGICVIMAAILGPVGALGDVAKGIGKFFASIGNLFVYGEYCADESACQEILSNKYYDTLEKKVNEAFKNCDNVDKEQVKDLITGTIFYDQMSYEYDYESESEETIETEKQEDQEAGYEQTENSGGYFDYRGKRGDIDPLVNKLKSNDDSSCVVNSFAYRNYLTNNYVKKNYKYILKGEYNKDGIEGRLTIDEVVNEIMMIGGFENLGANGACSSSCSYTVGDKSISELKVQLLDNDGNKIEGQQLISFENYILGVTYGEIGPDAPVEAAKAQAIAARSYSLTRASVMNGSGGVKLEEVDGQWILYIRNSTNDQVYCDPDKGCGKRADGVFISDPYSDEVDPNSNYKPKYGLATDAPLRAAVAEVVGIVAIDNEGNIVKTSYTETQHQEWRQKATEGLDYTEILKGSYNDIATLEEGNCSALCSFAAGPYTEWKQYNWPDVYMNSLSLKEAGCLTVSVAMQIARSGVETPLGENFSPATLVENYRKYLYTGNDNWVWAGISKVIPNFVWDSNYRLTGMQHLSDQQQIDRLLNGINAGCYYVVEVKSYRSGQHWVAIDTIKDGKIYMIDPGSNCKVLNECVASTGYNYRISTAQCYRVK